MTSPSDVTPKVLTRATSELNITEREVYCPQCKYKIMTKLPGPICGNCKSNLITITRTTPDELAG